MVIGITSKTFITFIGPLCFNYTIDWEALHQGLIGIYKSIWQFCILGTIHSSANSGTVNCLLPLLITNAENILITCFHSREEQHAAKIWHHFWGQRYHKWFGYKCKELSYICKSLGSLCSNVVLSVDYSRKYETRSVWNIQFFVLTGLGVCYPIKDYWLRSNKLCQNKNRFIWRSEGRDIT